MLVIEVLGLKIWEESVVVVLEMVGVICCVEVAVMNTVDAFGVAVFVIVEPVMRQPQTDEAYLFRRQDSHLDCLDSPRATSAAGLFRNGSSVGVAATSEGLANELVELSRADARLTFARGIVTVAVSVKVV